MTIKDTIKQQINQILVDKYQLTDINFQVEYPPNDKLGDYSCNVAMILAKKLKQQPTTIGAEIIEILNKKLEKNIFYKIEVVRPGFINFHLAEKWIANEMTKILKLGKKYGVSDLGKGQTVVVDYSAPNIAKKMHVGHLRSTVIGAAICNLYSFLNYKVIRDNHLGDWGTQFGKLIYEYKQKYGEKINSKITVEEMEKMYLDFHIKAKQKPELEDKARIELKKLQDKDKFNYKLWQLFYKISLEEFKKIYKILNVNFDVWHGESFYNNLLEQIVTEALKKKVAQKSEGAIIINLEKYKLPPLMIQKSDGAFLYGTTDLATIKYKHQKYKPIKNIYVVANQQTLHFEQLFKASELLGYHNQEKMVHVKFGLLLGKNGKKMATREGGVVDLLNIINEGIEKAKKRIAQKNNKLNSKELSTIAKIVALGAIKYNDLSQNRLTDIIFDWDKMLNFNSGSSPYLQYTYVRIKSIYKKTNKSINKANWKLLKKEIELKLIKKIIKFPEIIKIAAEEYKPNLIALYLESLAADFHSFYEQISIIKSEGEIKEARLALIKSIEIVIKNGLNILGIETPEKM